MKLKELYLKLLRGFNMTVFYFLSIFLFAWYVSKFLLARMKKNVIKISFITFMLSLNLVVLLKGEVMDYSSVDVMSLESVNIFLKCLLIAFCIGYSTSESGS